MNTEKSGDQGTKNFMVYIKIYSRKPWAICGICFVTPVFYCVVGTV
jgi:hypothetical protein